jgi:two-component system, LytTR family, sensor kinase
MNFSGLSGKKIHVSLHIIIWIALFIIPTYLLFLDSGDDPGFLSRAYIQTALYIAIFYLNYLWLAPRFFFRKKKLLFFVLSLLVMASAATVAQVTILSKFNEKIKHEQFAMPPRNVRFPMMPPSHSMPGEMHRPRPSKNWPMYNFMITGLLISGFALGLKFSDKLIQNEKERKESEKQRLNSELAFLKNQINPHFFFNTLNNIYSLVQSNADDGQKAILQLSKLMRYLLYETEQEMKPLSHEIDFMKNYIELMKLRLSDKVALSISFPDVFDEVAVPPLLFLPFIENAFKHGISYRKLSFINILMHVEAQQIHFECSNSIGIKGEELFKPGSGIGLDNVKKRLTLLFPGMHNLNIQSTAETFSVILNIFIPPKATQ